MFSSRNKKKLSLNYPQYPPLILSSVYSFISDLATMANGDSQFLVILAGGNNSGLLLHDNQPSRGTLLGHAAYCY